MAEDDDGWGGTLEDGPWPDPAQGHPAAGPGAGAAAGSAQPPPVPVATTPTGYPAPGSGAPFGTQPPWSGQPAPSTPGGPGGPAGRSRKIGLAIAAAIVVVVAVVLGVTLSGGSSKHQASPSTSPAVKPTPTPTPTTTAPTQPATSPASNAASALASIAPFSTCAASPPAAYPSTAVQAQIVCTGTDVQTSVSAEEVAYAKFSSAAGLASWYHDVILTANNIAAGTGNCATGALATTTNKAAYCEGSFTDDTGATASEVLILAPATAVISDGPTSTADACSSTSTYTLLIFTSPSDNVGAFALTCAGTPATTQLFQQHLTAGAYDLND
jgi:hypothetical protein